MANRLLLEDGSYILLEDGSGRLLLETPFDPRPVPGRAAVLSRRALASTITRTASGGYPVPVTGQTLDTIYQGEDVSIPFRITTDPSAWAVKFTLVPSSGSSVVQTGLSVSGTSPTWYITADLDTATTAALAVGQARFQLHRTDTGSAELLASGVLTVAHPLATIP